MKIIEDNISLSELKKMAEDMFGTLIKAVVDIEKEVMAVDAGMHSDEEELLLQNGSKQQNLWGINLYPEKTGEEFIEFDSMVNLRPSQGNRTRSVDDPKIREKIIIVVNKIVQK
ncbi:MAG: DUF5674 family protein [Candidatus Berkelbacteria bacterium]|nr:DUF5674 family protein [Candidatus Berkelbacteria bacterium]